MGDDQGHITDQERGLHDKRVTTDGTGTGSCLHRHVSAYQKKHSCSHRWQAHQASMEKVHDGKRRDIYDGVDAGRVPAQWKKFIKFNKQRQCDCVRYHVPLPEKGDWDLEGPPAGRQQELKRTGGAKPKDGDIVNFSSSSLWPYWHNAHHLIPQGRFNSVIDEVAGKECPNDRGECVLAIKMRLLKAKYNINHQKNMIILPGGQTVAGILGLPRHLTKKPKGKSEKGLVAEHRGHQEYDNTIVPKLKKVFVQAAKAFKKKKCELTKADLDKEKLNQISKEAYEMIIDLGADQEGLPLAAITLKEK